MIPSKLIVKMAQKEFFMKNNDYYRTGNFLDFSPAIFFITLYCSLFFYTLYTKNIYNTPRAIISELPLFVVFITTIYAFFTFKKNISIHNKITFFLHGSMNEQLAYFYCSLITATSFAHILAKTGVISTIINLHIITLPSVLILPIIFCMASLISIIIRSWIVSIILYLPIIFGLALSLQINPALMIATTISGIICGYQLILPSIYTINNQSYKEMIRLIIPPLLSTLIILSIYKYQILDPALYTSLQSSILQQDYISLLPFLVFLGAALLRINILINLIFGLSNTIIMGILQDKILPLNAVLSIFEGFYNQRLMVKLLIFTVFLAGLSNLLTHNNGFNYLINSCKHKIKKLYIAEITIIFIISIINLITTFDFLSIKILSPITKNLSHQYSLSYQRIAGLLYVTTTIFSCLLPYSPIILIATYLSNCSSMEIISYMIYPILLYLYTILSIFTSQQEQVYAIKHSENISN